MSDLLNTFAVNLKAGKPQIGLWLALADAYCAEISAGAGFDWLLIDGEHAPNDVRSTLRQLQTLAAYPVTPLVRPPSGETWMIKQYLDLGVQTLLVPMVESAGQARELVRATQYPPHGLRGVGSALARASRWNQVPEYLTRAGGEICLLVQIESQAGLDALDEIAAVEGVAGLFIGPADLSASLGHLGNPNHPDVLSAIEDAVKRIQAAGKAAGILATDEAQARRYLALGCTFVAVGVDTSLLAKATRDLARRFKATGGEGAGSEGSSPGDSVY